MSDKMKAHSSAATLEQAMGADRGGQASHNDCTIGGNARQLGAVSNILQYGREQAIPGRDLVALLGLKSLRDLTMLIERARERGSPICASTDSASPGYYLASDATELEDYIKSLDRRITNVTQTREYLENTLDEMVGQEADA